MLYSICIIFSHSEQMLKSNLMNANNRLLTKIAILYYREGLTQEEISHRLGISRPTIGRYLQRARTEGIVHVEIKSPLSFCTGLETQLEAAFHLSEAIVVTPPVEGEEALKMALGEAAAEFIERRVQSGDIIGVSWSSTVLQCAVRLRKMNTSRVSVVQMNGSLDRANYSTRAEYIVDRFAQAFNARSMTLVAPLLLDRPDIKTSLMSDSHVNAALELAKKANIAVYGVGEISEHSSLYKTGYMNLDLLHELQASGAVGDICGHFFNDHGHICLQEVENRTLAIGLDSLKNISVSMAIAGGVSKKSAILGMLAGKLCTVLVTDEETARLILDQTK